MTEETIFAEVLERRTPAERAAYLDEACAGDAALRQRVEALLRSHERAGEFLERPALEQISADAPRPELEAGTGAHRVVALQADPAGAGPTQAPAEGPDDIPLDFLGPPQEPGHLGRLGPYEVAERIGRGGMGAVLKAFDERLRRVVALKVMAPQLAASASARRRFTREAQAAAAVRDEHVTAIYEVGEAGGLPYLVMEYVSGASLQERLDRAGPLPLAETLRIGVQVAAGLAAAHRQGLVHRDVKPANILLENGVQRVKLTDFGLARAVDDASVTQSGVIAGTPQYMAPEQARGEAVDHRADLFSLGSVLYALCTGRPPFRASTSMAVLKRVSEDTPRPVRDINPDIPAWLAGVIEKLHAKDPARRFQSAAEVAALLSRHLARLQQPGSAPAPAAEPARPRPAARPRRRRRAEAIAGLLLLLGGLGLAESAGVTQIVPAVLRIVTGEGTLVVDVQDPEVSVTIDGEDLVITGAGPKEVRLRPGSYQVRAARDGQPVPLDNDLVTITRGGKQVIKVSREGAGQARASPPIRLRSTLRGEGNLTRVAFAGDGTVLASVRDDGRVVLWDVATAQVKMTLEGHRPLATAVAFSPDAKLLATASGDWRKPDINGEVKLWDPAAGKLLFTLPSSTGPIYSVAFAPDGKSLAAVGQKGTVELWDPATGKAQGLLKSAVGTAYALSYAPDGKTLAVSNYDLVQLWDVATRRRTGLLSGHRDEVESVAFSPDGKTLATGSRDRTIKLWDVATRRERATLKGNPGWVRSLAFSPDGAVLVSGCNENVARLWDAASGKLLLEVPQPGIPAGSTVAFSGDGKTLAAGGNGTIRLWDVTSVRPEPRAAEPVRPQPPAGREQAPVPLQTTLHAPPGNIIGLAFSHDGRWLAAASAEGKAVQLWRRTEAGWREDATLRGLTDKARGVAFSADDTTLATGSHDGTVRLFHWDGTAWREGRVLKGHAQQVYAVAFAPDGKSLASAGGQFPEATPGEIKLWDMPAGVARRNLRGHATFVNGLAFSPDSRTLASAGADTTVILWDVATGRRIATLEGGANGLNSVAFAPDGKMLAAGGAEKAVALWKWDGGLWRAQAPLRGHTDMVWPVAFSPDGKRLASGGWDRTVRLWDPATGQELATLAHTDQVWSVAFAPDGKTLAAGCMNGTVRLWDVSAGTAAGPRGTGEPPARPFAIPSRGGRAEQSFATLAEAAAAAGSGDTVEVRGDGPFLSQPIAIGAKALTVRAGEGFCPVLKLDPEKMPGLRPLVLDTGHQLDQPLLQTHGPLVLEGLEIQRGDYGEGQRPLVFSWRAPLHVANCRFLAKPECQGIIPFESPLCEVRNCAFFANRWTNCVDWRPPPGGRLLMDNNLLSGAGGVALAVHHYVPRSAPGLHDVSVRLTRNTYSVGSPVAFGFGSWPDLPAAGANGARPIRVESSANILDGQAPVYRFGLPVREAKDRQLNAVQARLRAVLDWHEERNLYRAGGEFVSLSFAGPAEPLPGLRGPDDWRRFWGGGAVDARQGTIKYQGGDVVARAANAPEKLTPEDFRLPPDGDGYRAGRNGRDLGADVELIGPGKAYERWKKTFEYQRWLKDTGEAEASARPFVVLARDGKPEQRFATLAGAVAAAAGGETIEVRGDGPFLSQPVYIRGAGLTIRAAKPFRPVIRLSPEGVAAKAPLLDCDAPLVLEGLDLQRAGQPGEGHYATLLHSRQAPLRAANCRFLLNHAGGGSCVLAEKSPACLLRNCEFITRTSTPCAVDCVCVPQGQFLMDNCLHLGGDTVAAHYRDLDPKEFSFRLARNTLVGEAFFRLNLDQPPKLSGELDPAPPLRVEASANVISVRHSVLVCGQSPTYLAQAKDLRPDEVKALLPRLVAWRDRGNLFAPGKNFLAANLPSTVLPLQGPGSVGAWERFWGVAETGSREADVVRYQGGDLRAKLPGAAEQITPQDFRLLPGSPGKGAGEAGRDLGADVDLVGPGPAYERWKKTPEYQQWLRDVEAGRPDR
jgi:WD40 repeat protein